MLDNSQPSNKLKASVKHGCKVMEPSATGCTWGKLAAENGQPQHPAIAHWSTGQDRAGLTAGYRRGYNDSLADLEP
jgi:hypothetical protein